MSACSYALIAFAPTFLSNNYILLKIFVIYYLSIISWYSQATLQFCIVKPIVALMTLILQAFGLYHDGDFS